MQRRSLPLVFGTVILVASPEIAGAAELNGSYTSNMGNRMTIKGSSYTYRHRSNPNSYGSGRIRKLAGSSYQFSGMLDYVCVRSGTTLSCGGGRRVWKKQLGTRL
jgi:hypothetical protein